MKKLLIIIIAMSTLYSCALPKGGGCGGSPKHLGN